MFSGITFIKPDIEFKREFTKTNHAPMFRKKFDLSSTGEAKLTVCALGCGYFYINGTKVSQDLFCAPVSDYTKTLWYNTYDVSHLLTEGENVISAICGNSWFNEEFSSAWDYDKAPWRDLPQFILKLTVNGKTAVVSDDTWKCMPDSAIWFNALRSGEYFDANKYDEKWTDVAYDDSAWQYACINVTPPQGIFRECRCEPIREFEVFRPISVTKVGAGKYVYDIGQNISGYIRITIAGNKGDLVTIKYSEEIYPDGDINQDYLSPHIYYDGIEFQTDKLLLSGQKFTWSPCFTYHGFRYISLEGIDNPDDVEVAGVFVHQAVDTRSSFECSDEFLNDIFRAGVRSSWSNMFYSITDCPTREKLGWTNDAQSSAEQLLTDFRCENLLEKWLRDIYDAMKPDGCLTGTIPSAGWGYEWGNGPVSDGVLFELPYKIYQHTGNPEPLKESLEYFERYLTYLDTKTENGLITFGLNDWARLNQHYETEDDIVVPAEMINAVLLHRFYKITSLAKKMRGENSDKYQLLADKQKRFVISRYISADGSCTIHKQTAVALLIYYDLYDDISPLKSQLKSLVEEHSFRHDCGMVGMRRILHALCKCGLQEYAYKILTAHERPCYRSWIDGGATSLWEFWDEPSRSESCSKNHHMYSDVLSWMIKNITGIRQREGSVAFEKVDICPYFFEELTYAKGTCDTAGGTISVSWCKENDTINLNINIPDGIQAYYKDKLLDTGKNIIIINIEEE